MTRIFTIKQKKIEYQSHLVDVLNLLWSCVTSFIAAVNCLFFPEVWQRWVLLIFFAGLIYLINRGLNQKGYVRLVNWSLPVMYWLLVTIPIFTAGGVNAPGIFSQMALILTASLLLGWKGGLTIALFSIGTDFAIAYLELTHLLSAHFKHTPITRWIGSIVPFGTIIALQYYATQHMRNSLFALQAEMTKREDAEHTKDQTLHILAERVKELKTLYTVTRILQDEDRPYEQLMNEVVNIIPSGWHHPDTTAAHITIAAKEYKTSNYQPLPHSIQSELLTAKGTRVSIEVVFLQPAPAANDDMFVSEGRSLIDMLTAKIKNNLESRERKTELKDYQYALDLSSIVSITNVDGRFLFVNDNFCKISKYRIDELIGRNIKMIWSGVHEIDYYIEIDKNLQNGKPLRTEFCNRAKDGTHYWVETSIIPFIDQHGKLYQYLSISHDITERKEAEEKIRESEQLLRKITSQVPGNTYMFELEESGRSHTLFFNRGTDPYNPIQDIDNLMKDPDSVIHALHEDDKPKFLAAMAEGVRTEKTISVQYRVVVNNHVRWRWLQAVPEKREDGHLVWYGSSSDITPLVDYIVLIEQNTFDISHVLRRPLASMMGITSLINDNKLSDEELHSLSERLHQISQEMDKFIRGLNQAYDEKKQNTHFSIDFSDVIDHRDSLFG